MALRKPRQFWNDIKSDWTTRVRRDVEDAHSRARGDGAQHETQRQSAATTRMRRVMPDLYFVNTPAPHMVRHWDLLQKLPQENIVFDFHRHEGARLTNLTICAIDGSEPGLLSKVCGTLAAFNIDVRSALIYTARGEDLHRELQTAQQESQQTAQQATQQNANIEYSTPDFDISRGIALDTLVLSEAYRGRERALSDATQKRVRSEIKRILRNEITVAQLLSKRRSRAFPPLNVLNIAATPGVSSSQRDGEALITMRAQDSVGILYRTTTAIASLGLNIRIAQINAHDGMTEDFFFVSSATGKTLGVDECHQLANRLRAALQRGEALFDSGE